MTKWTITACAVALLACGRAEAQCATASFSPATVDFAETWDPLDVPEAKVLTFTATFSNFAAGSSKIKLIFLDNEAGILRLGTAGPKYTVTSGSETYAYASGTSIANQPDILIPSGQNNNIVKQFNVTLLANNAPPEDFTGGQTLSETLKFNVQCLKDKGTEVAQSVGQTGPVIRVTIPRKVSLTVAGPQTINFGNFSVSEQQLAVGLKSTSTINVAVSTANNNRMLLEGASDPTLANSSIPYTMTLNGQAIANGVSLTNQTRAGVTGTNWPLILRLSGTGASGKIAGVYSDTITLTLSPGT